MFLVQFGCDCGTGTLSQVTFHFYGAISLSCQDDMTIFSVCAAQLGFQTKIAVRSGFGPLILFSYLVNGCFPSHSLASNQIACTVQCALYL